MDMDLVDDLELLDDYDDLEFDRFGVAAGDTSRQNKNKHYTTSAAEYRNGKDMQGIPWERLHYSRDDYRGRRLNEYMNYESLFRSHELLDSECKQVDKKGTFYDFCFNTRLARSTVVHFQLRDLVWATSKHDVYMAQNYSVMHWSSLLQKGEEVLNAIDNVFPKQYVDQPGVAFCTSVTEDDDNITNTVDLYESPNGSTRVIAGNNDCVVRVFDTERFRLLSHFTFPWSVNDTSVSPDGKLVAVLGDSSDCLIADLQSGKEIASLKGHLDYSFSSAWHPDGRVLATGNQDTTCRLWDVRNLSRSLAVLRGRIGAVRGLRFSSDGRFLAAAEAADFVHVYDARAGYSREQEIDIFGEVAGVSFSPDAEALFVGVADRTYGSLIEFRRRHRYEYLDSYL
ncbi:putative WD repeat-containing protein C2A9.03-like isoform X2 [Panicum miliaceum]|uniref:WD repeat-containing protein C2A9.03-like isoform X2 n=1 Tax=Panicum miliaceum TaxID=4540 RepID=A0A3L6QUL5_PANMI|nr:putative WD repeat-containing protein C2A9.03-like isoform X2 [Panicum miliaceum]